MLYELCATHFVLDITSIVLYYMLNMTKRAILQWEQLYLTVNLNDYHHLYFNISAGSSGKLYGLSKGRILTPRSSVKLIKLLSNCVVYQKLIEQIDFRSKNYE